MGAQKMKMPCWCCCSGTQYRSRLCTGGRPGHAKSACRAAVAIAVHRGGGGGGVAIVVPLVVPIPLVVSIVAPLVVLAS